MVDDLLVHVRKAPFDVYAEPFLGGGALFRALQPLGLLDGRRVVLSDWSPDTLVAWCGIRDDIETTTKSLDEMSGRYAEYEPAERGAMFYAQRSAWNSGHRTAARHIFLRQTCFNGLWRVNKTGGFNVPWGKYVKFRVPEELPRLSAALQSVELHVSRANDMLAKAGPGWLVYCDPPYVEEFAQYTADGFSHDDQVELVRACAKAAGRGARVVYSNRWCDAVRSMVDEHWTSAVCHRHVIPQTVAATSAARGVVEELVAT